MALPSAVPINSATSRTNGGSIQSASQRRGSAECLQFASWLVISVERKEPQAKEHHSFFLTFLTISLNRSMRAQNFVGKTSESSVINKCAARRGQTRDLLSLVFDNVNRKSSSRLRWFDHTMHRRCSFIRRDSGARSEKR